MNDMLPSAEAAAVVPQAGLRFFWQPGCSSCVKVKEMLAELGVPFTSVNILETDGALDELLARGLRSVPVMIFGDKVSFAQSLEDVATFVGRERTTNRLPPEELMTRWRYFLDVALGLVRQVPPGDLETRPVANRPRTVCNLSYHIFQVPEGFLALMLEGHQDSRDYDNAVYDHLRTVEDILGYAEGIVARLDRFWAELTDKSGRQMVETYYGKQPMHQVLDRATWHSAQHTRQLNSVLDGFGIAVRRPIDPAAYEGLPMPRALWE